MILWAEMDADNTGQVIKDEFEEGRESVNRVGRFFKFLLLR